MEQRCPYTRKKCMGSECMLWVSYRLEKDQEEKQTCAILYNAVKMGHIERSIAGVQQAVESFRNNQDRVAKVEKKDRDTFTDLFTTLTNSKGLHLQIKGAKND